MELLVVPESAHTNGSAGRAKGLLGSTFAIVQPEVGQVAGQVYPLVIPDEIPVDDRMLLDEHVFGKARVALLAEHVLQLLAQHQRIEIGHGDGLRKLTRLLQ